MSVVEVARREAQQLLQTAPPALAQPLLTALLTTQRALLSSTAIDPALEHVRRLARRCGRRLEDLVDGPAAPSQSQLVARFIEPDLLPFVDALAVFVGRAARDDALADVGEAVAVVVEEDLGPAVLAAGLFSFEVPRPGLTLFDPRRHQLAERAPGKRDVVVDLHRFGRTGAGGRLVDAAVVVVGEGP